MSTPAPSQQPSPSVVPAGWYPDPQDGRVQRWWDGYQWTQHTNPPSQSPLLRRPGSLYNAPKDAAAGKNSAGTWSLVMGIAAVILGILLVTSLFSLLAGIAAIIWGGIGLARANRYGVKRGTSIAGLILGILTVLLALVWFGSAYN